MESDVELATDQLAPGTSTMFRLVASDGFNTSEATVGFTLQNPLPVVSVFPAEGETDIGTLPEVAVFFGTDLDADQITDETFTLSGPSGNVPTHVGYDEATKRAWLMPQTALANGALYTATLSGEVTDVYGSSPDGDLTWSFTTAPDTEAPRVVAVFPRDGATGYNPAAWIRISFSEDIDPETIDDTSIAVEDGAGNSVAASVNYDVPSRIATFRPNTRLELNTTYDVTVGTGVQDIAGNAMAAPFTWSFTTSMTAPAEGSFNGFFNDAGVDQDGDGYFDYLRVDIGVTLLTGMDVHIVGSLTDGNGNVFLQSEADAGGVLEAGDHTGLLLFPGVDIAQHGQPGPYSVGPLFLYDASNDTWTVLDQRESAYETAAYSITTFQPPNANLTGTYSDAGLDTDGDELFDQFVITVDMMVHQSGTYRVRGVLYDANGYFIESAEASNGFNTGAQTLELSFSGGRIRGHGDASPYELRYVDLFDASNSLLASVENAYVTGVYDPESFESSPPDLQSFTDQVALVEGTPDDDLVTIRARVFNFGGTAVEEAVVRITVAGTQLGDDGVLSDLTAVPQEIFAEWNTSGATGSPEIRVSIDPDNTVPEIDEGNNVVIVNVAMPIAGFPDSPTGLGGTYDTSAGAAQLQWTPPSTSWSGFHVYSRLAGTEDPFTRLTPLPLSSVSYTDATVVEGETYEYYVAALVTGQPSFEGTPSASFELETASGPTGSVDVDILEGWNMVGQWVDVADASYQTLYPNSLVGTFFGFNGAYYQPSPTNLTLGGGYWLRFDGEETVTVEGGIVQDVTLELIKGWNMISGLDCTIPFSAIADPDDILIPNTLFSFSGSYVSATAMRLGRAYWIRTDEMGDVMLSCSPGKTGVASSDLFAQLQGFSSLRLSDGSGAPAQTLFFGGRLPDGLDTRSFSMPPLPPAGTFDARFTNDLLFATGADAEIRLQSARRPIRISTQLNASDQLWKLLALAGGTAVSEHLLDGTSGDVSLSAPNITALRLMQLEALPREFSLEGNYPNPFNPETTIRYTLPKSLPMRLEVFDVLGRRVAVLLDEEEHRAGVHDVRWVARDGSGGPLSSGLYFYVLTAGPYRAIGKMSLLK